MISIIVGLGGILFCLKMVILNGCSFGGVGCSFADGIWCLIGVLICVVVVFRVVVVVMSGLTWSVSSINIIWCGFQWFWMVSSSCGCSGTVVIGVVSCDLVIGDLSVVSGCPVVSLFNGLI